MRRDKFAMLKSLIIPESRDSVGFSRRRVRMLGAPMSNVLSAPISCFRRRWTARPWVINKHVSLQVFFQMVCALLILLPLLYFDARRSFLVHLLSILASLGQDRITIDIPWRWWSTTRPPIGLQLCRKLSIQLRARLRRHYRTRTTKSRMAVVGG